MTSRAQIKSVQPSLSVSGQETFKKPINGDLLTVSVDSPRIRIFALLVVVMSLEVISYSAQLPLFVAILNHSIHMIERYY